MSGFEYHLVCRACGLASETYPYRHDSVIAPTVLILPTIDRAARAFGRLEVPLRWRLTEPREVAAALSTPDVTVCAPLTGPHELAVPCPRCGAMVVESAFGSAKSSRPPPTTS